MSDRPEQDEPSMLTSVFEMEGEYAFADNKPREQNPHPAGGTAYRHWHKGWDAAAAASGEDVPKGRPIPEA